MINTNNTNIGRFSRSVAAGKWLQSCPTLCDPMDSSPPGSSAPGILQARTLECVAISFSNARMHAKSVQSCLTLCDPMDSSPPGSPVPGILQARTLEWVVMPSPPGDLPNPGIKPGSPALQADSWPTEPPRKLLNTYWLHSKS